MHWKESLRMISLGKLSKWSGKIKNSTIINGLSKKRQKYIREFIDKWDITTSIYKWKKYFDLASKISPCLWLLILFQRMSNLVKVGMEKRRFFYFKMTLRNRTIYLILWLRTDSGENIKAHGQNLHIKYRFQYEFER